MAQRGHGFPDEFKGTTNDGSTNVIECYNSDEQLIARIDTLGNIFTEGHAGFTVISGTAILNFGEESNSAIISISNIFITNASIKSISFLNIETSESSLDDFTLNGIIFNIENIIDNTSFDIRGSAVNDASGNFTLKYFILI